MEGKDYQHIIKEDIFLKEENTRLASVLKEKEAEIAQLQIDVFYLKQELDKLKKLAFGQKRERYLPAETGQLTLDMEVPAIEPTPVVIAEKVEYTRHKKDKKIKETKSQAGFPSHLPRVRRVIEPEADLRGAKKIGETITEYLEWKPGKPYVLQLVFPKYLMPSRPKEEQNQNKEQDEKCTIITGIHPSRPVPRGNFGPGLMAHITISKYVDHMPLYRLAKQFERDYDVLMAESSLSDCVRATGRLLDPLYVLLKAMVQKSVYLMIDETRIPVQTRDKPGATHKGYFWDYYALLEKLVYFEYRKGRGREGPTEFLKEFQGTLQTDGYVGYDIFDHKSGIVLLACMAHARRKFVEALENDPPRASHVLDLMLKLYKVEARAREEQLNPEQRKSLREKESVPVLEELEQWLRQELVRVLPQSAIGKAITYTLGLWHRLKRYVEDGRYEIDNNLIENSIRPIALGRKNYLFAGSHEAAQCSAVIYSLLITCKLQGVNPFKWLRHVLTVIQDYNHKHLEELLPHRWKDIYAEENTGEETDTKEITSEERV